ncbi:MAG: NUDIX hydrolase [Saprospiraceae bacterium]
MKKYLPLVFLLCFIASACSKNQDAHQKQEDNFTINRLIIVNDNNEVLMMREKHVWATPSFLYNERQYVKEGLDSLANAYGVKIENLQLHGHFSFKYDYHSYATLRNYYVARYVSGEIKVPEGMNEVKWMPAAEAIEQNSVTAIKQITRQIMNHPNTVWGGSFMVSHVGDDHPTKMVEDFYPLFEAGE